MHKSAALLKWEIETKLANRIPGALSTIAQQAPRLHPLGNIRLDALLGGGLPLGSVCELTGPDGSGRGSIALSLLASALDEGACAYMDVSDTLSPESVAAAGVELGNLLWVRFAAGSQRQTPELGRPTSSKPFRTESGSHSPVHGGCGSSHPRGETKGLAPALEQMLFDKDERRRRKLEGTPGQPNHPLGLHTASQDHVEWERWNLRKVDETDPLRQMDLKAAGAARQRAASSSPVVTARAREQKPWDRLDRALRATDQVLQCERARAAGIEHGMSKVQAEAGSAAHFRAREIGEEKASLALAVEVAGRFSPRVEAIASPMNGYAGAHRPSVVLLLDSSGTRTLFGSAEIYARKLYQELRSAGFPARIGTAPNAEAALMLARSTQEVVCADRDSIRGKLSRLPAQRSKGDGVASFHSVEQHADGLVCMTGGDEGPLAAALERDGREGGRKVLTRLVQTFGPKNVYVELQRHGICEQETRNQAAISLARELHLPLLATNGVSMATECEREILDVLTSIRHGCSLDDAGLLLQQNGKRYMRSAAEMRALFRDVPQAITATGELSDRLTFQMKDSFVIGFT